MSPSSPTRLTSMPNIFIIVAILSPASLALMSKATPILAAVVVKSIKFSLAMPSCPPLAVIWASSLTLRGISRLIFISPSANCLISSAPLKSTTFLTSAIELSKSIAALMGFEIAMILPTAAKAWVFRPSRFFLASSMSKFSLCVTAFLMFSLRLARSV